LLGRFSKSLNAMGRADGGHGGVVNVDIVGVIAGFGCGGFGFAEVS
jgi:hypothetical protein